MKSEPATNIAISVNNISKEFHITEDSHNTVKQRLFRMFDPPHPKTIKALNPMSFEIKKGECLGLVGRNGSGKSTLVRVLAGVYPTSTGTIKISGSTMLMNLGVGMSHQLTARENIYISGSVLGLKIKEIDQIFDQIIEFAELQNFVDTKIKYFSSGMLARLGFSIAVNAGADIMFLDEIFAVGDIKFQEKAIKIFEKSWIEGKTVVLISHETDVIKNYCQRAIYLKNGNLEYIGEAKTAIDKYLSDNQ
jgi:ABC-type polysaccharide/polyol phosphate transport system ATPase subunit